jgi:hypothetical protein
LAGKRPLEDKNVHGMTVRSTMFSTLVAFFEHHDELVGPILTLSLKGNF